MGEVLGFLGGLEGDFEDEVMRGMGDFLFFLRKF